MPLPANYNKVEHWQDTVRRLYNKEVRDWFSDLDPDDLGLNTPRIALRTACHHDDADSLQLSLGRMMLFDFVVARKLQGVAGGAENSPPYTVNRRQKPQILLYFLEDLDNVDPPYRQVEGRISFRLMEESVGTLTNADATTYANRIKTAFGSAGGYLWKKGKIMAVYADWEKGYQLQLLSSSEAEAKEVIGKVLDIQNHSPDWEYLSLSENNAPTQAYPTLPPTQTILGKSRRLARRRPRADVRFQYAVLKLAGLPNPIALYDRSGVYPDPLVM